MNPSILGKDKAVEVFTEVLHHVVTLRFAMDEEVKTDALLEADDTLDLLLEEVLILLLRDLTLGELGTSRPDFLGLLKR